MDDELEKKLSIVGETTEYYEKYYMVVGRVPDVRYTMRLDMKNHGIKPVERSPPVKDVRSSV